MVRHMSEGQVARYKERAVADMRMNKRTYIRCPCRTCKLGSLIDHDSADLESHLLTRGFMTGYDSEDDEDVNNGHYKNPCLLQQNLLPYLPFVAIKGNITTKSLFVAIRSMYCHNLALLRYVPFLLQ
jgi:hypothetical protein